MHSTIHSLYSSSHRYEVPNGPYQLASFPRLALFIINRAGGINMSGNRNWQRRLRQAGTYSESVLADSLNKAMETLKKPRANQWTYWKDVLMRESGLSIRKAWRRATDSVQWRKIPENPCPHKKTCRWQCNGHTVTVWKIEMQDTHTTEHVTAYVTILIMHSGLQI